MAATADYEHDMIMMTLLERQLCNKYSVIAVITANGVRHMLMLIRKNACTGVCICVAIKKIHDLYLYVSKHGFLL